MSIQYLRALTAPERTKQSNAHLGLSLAFIAGAINAGGFLAVERYTSHVTGLVSSMADDIVLGNWALAATGVVALIAFMGGAAMSAILVNWARRNGSRQVCTLPLLIEAALLLVFGVLGELNHIIGTQLLTTVGLLCFVMGLQNALITKLSHAEIRTTHLTGLVTDMGIEIGKMLYWNAAGEQHPRVQANKERLRLQSGLVLAFFVGGVTGAWGFLHVGYGATVPLALTLALLSSVQWLPEHPPRHRH